jgi:hypothetical protein
MKRMMRKTEAKAFIHKEKEILIIKGIGNRIAISMSKMRKIMEIK